MISGFFQAEIESNTKLKNSTEVYINDTVSKNYWSVHKDCSQVTTAQGWSETTSAPPT